MQTTSSGEAQYLRPSDRAASLAWRHSAQWLEGRGPNVEQAAAPRLEQHSGVVVAKWIEGCSACMLPKVVQLIQDNQLGRRLKLGKEFVVECGAYINKCASGWALQSISSWEGKREASLTTPSDCRSSLRWGLEPLGYGHGLEACIMRLHFKTGRGCGPASGTCKHE
eukprot:SM000083S22711  [mRNA]  locus=s83:32257:32754:+ [translate_table: standard]